MIYTDIIERKDTITIDGYSNRKTVNGALKDLAREIRKYDEGEADCILEAIKFKEVCFLDGKDGGYMLQIEEVECAARINEETDETEYKEANYYLVCRFMK